MAESLFFNPKLLRFYRETFGSRLNVVIDVGANLGQTIDLVMKVNPDCEVYALEPNPKLFKRLEQKYAHKKNIRLFRLGISDVNGTRHFHENVLHSTSSLEELNYESEYLKKKSKFLGVAPKKIIAGSYPIEVMKLSDFIAAHISKDHIDLVKIDTEGHEYSCLAGLFSGPGKYPQYIQFENHNDDMYKSNKSFAEIESILLQNGYALKRKIRHGFGDFDEMIYQKADIR